MKVIKQRNKLHREGWILQLKVPQIQSTAAPGPGPSTFCFTNPSCVCASTAQQAFAKKKCLSTTSWYNHCLHKVGTDLCTKSNKSQELGVKGVREGAEHRPARERAKDGGMEASARTLTSAAEVALGTRLPATACSTDFQPKARDPTLGILTSEATACTPTLPARWGVSTRLATRKDISLTPSTIF